MANILDIARYIVSYPLFSAKAFWIKLFKNFEEQVEGFLNFAEDNLVKKLGYPA